MGGFSGSIADAIRRLGDAQAQGALRSGEIRGNMASQLGQIPGQIIGMKQHQDQLTQQTAMNKNALAVSGLQQEKQQKDKAADAEIKAILANTPQDQKVEVWLNWVQQNHPLQYAESVAKLDAMGLRKGTATARQDQSAIQMNNAISGTPGPPGLPTVQAQPAPDPTGQMQLQPQAGPPEQNHFQIPTSMGPMTPPTAGQKLQQMTNEKRTLSQAEAEGKAMGTPAKPGKQIERTVDLGDQVEYIYTDGTKETKPKGVSPNTSFTIDNRPAKAEKQGQFVGTTDEGGVKKAVVFKDGVFSTVDLPGGTALGGKTTPAMTQNRITAANNSLHMGEEVLKYLEDPKVKAGLGPLMGRVTGWKNLVGNPPPELAELSGLLKSWSELQPAVHGMRSSEMAEDIERSAPTHMTPEALAGFIRGFQRTARTVANSEQPGGNAPAFPQGAGETKVINGVTYRKVQGGWQKAQ